MRQRSDCRKASELRQDRAVAVRLREPRLKQHSTSLAGYLIARNLPSWKLWAPVLFLAGTLISIAFGLGMIEITLASGEKAWRRASTDCVMRGTFCWLLLGSLGLRITDEGGVADNAHPLVRSNIEAEHERQYVRQVASSTSCGAKSCAPNATIGSSDSHPSVCEMADDLKQN